MRIAVLALIERDDGLILGVSRKGRPQDMGLPGGKADAGEAPEVALARELAEETGLELVSASEVYRAGEGAFTVITYRATVRGTIHTAEEGRVAWIAPAELIRGTFCDYNRGLLAAIGGSV